MFREQTGIFMNFVLGVDFQPNGDIGALWTKPDVEQFDWTPAMRTERESSGRRRLVRAAG